MSGLETVVWLVIVVGLVLIGLIKMWCEAGWQCWWVGALGCLDVGRCSVVGGMEWGGLGGHGLGH